MQRPRPCDALGRPLALVDLPDPFSFPSGHPIPGLVALPLAGVIAASRVYLRVHHVSDVLAGAALGLAGAIAAAALLR